MSPPPPHDNTEDQTENYVQGACTLKGGSNAIFTCNATSEPHIFHPDCSATILHQVTPVT
jgi:hypothetical protein